VRSHVGGWAVVAMLFAGTFAIGSVRATEIRIGVVGLDTDQFFNFVGSDIVLNANEPISVNDDDVRTFGGNSHDMQIGDDDIKHAPLTMPEPATLALLGAGMVALGTVARRRKKLAS
jgi:hypothetical protein